MTLSLILRFRREQRAFPEGRACARTRFRHEEATGRQPSLAPTSAPENFAALRLFAYVTEWAGRQFRNSPSGRGTGGACAWNLCRRRLVSTRVNKSDCKFEKHAPRCFGCVCFFFLKCPYFGTRFRPPPRSFEGSARPSHRQLGLYTPPHMRLNPV